MNEFLNTPIEFLKGVGPNRAELLKKEDGIYTFDDLLNYFPFRYVDRSQYHTVAELPQLDGYVQLKGKIIHVSEKVVGKQNRLHAKFQDRTGVIELVWFQGGKWIKPLLKPDVEFQVYGKAKLFGFIPIPRFSMSASLNKSPDPQVQKFAELAFPDPIVGSSAGDTMLEFKERIMKQTLNKYNRTRDTAYRSWVKLNKDNITVNPSLNNEKFNQLMTDFIENPELFRNTKMITKEMEVHAN